MAPESAIDGDVKPATGRQLAGAGEISLQELQETFDEWRIFARDGAWWAIRSGTLYSTGRDSLLRRCLTASDLDGLAERLCVQDWLDDLDEEALAAVYGLDEEALAAVYKKTWAAS